MKNQTSIKQLVGRAISAYNKEQHNDCTGYVEFSGDGAELFTVHTTVAKGDNVPWAKKPMAYVFGVLDLFGIKAQWSTETHCCGNVTLQFKQ